jgi:hypothetical protein
MLTKTHSDDDIPLVDYTWIPTVTAGFVLRKNENFLFVRDSRVTHSIHFVSEPCTAGDIIGEGRPGEIVILYMHTYMRER